MKKLCIGSILCLFFLGSCAQNKEKREEFKDEHDKNALRNKMGDSAVAHSETIPATIPDSGTVKTNIPKK